MLKIKFHEYLYINWFKFVQALVSFFILCSQSVENKYISPNFEVHDDKLKILFKKSSSFYDERQCEILLLLPLFPLIPNHAFQEFLLKLKIELKRSNIGNDGDTM